MSRLALLALLGASGCVVGAPPGFSDGDRWTAPLVAPLEGDVLLVPVTIKGKGPYLFMVDPDSNVSSLDSALVSDLELYSAYGPEEINEADRKVQTFIAEVTEAHIGELGIRNQKWRIHEVGTFWVGGRRVRGVLGRDVIADSLILAIDRDRGLLQLATQGNLEPPAGATPVSFRPFFNRKLADVTLDGGREVTVHLDLGGRLSRLWPETIEAAGLPRAPVKAELIDEYGTKQTVQGGGIATVSAGSGISSQGLLLVPFADRRVEKEDMDGALGQNFFADFHVTANWHKKTVWLKPRAGDLHATAAERIGRWGSMLEGCRALGCVTAEVARAEPAAEEPEPAAPAAPAMPGDPAPASDPSAEPVESADPAPVSVVLTREAPASEHRLEVLLDAVGRDGKSLGMPRIQATFMPGTNRIAATLDPSYEGAAGLVVLDVSPLGRACSGQNRSCLWMQSVQY